MHAGVFSASKAALATPQPHVYQSDPQGNSVPITPPDELRQDAAAALQTGTSTPAGTVKVQELDRISAYHVGPHVSDTSVAFFIFSL